MDAGEGDSEGYGEDADEGAEVGPHDDFFEVGDVGGASVEGN